LFAHIHGQQKITELLSREIVNRELPQALLFYGEEYTGRMTAALETARILHCSMGGVPACTCSSCASSRRLTQPYTLVFANRRFLPVMQAAAKGYRLSRNQAGKLLAEQNFRLLLKRFDSIWDLQQKDEEKKLTDLKELLDEFIGREDRHEEAQERSIEELIRVSRKLTEEIKSMNIPVHSLRSMQNWLHTKPKHQRAVVILEGIEHFAEASKHALLKFLEEPPPAVTVILISEGRGRILPTVLSRVRKYPFLPRSAEDQSRVIADTFFSDPEGYDSLRTFFLSQGGIDCRFLREEVQAAAEGLMSFGEYDHRRFARLLQHIDDQGAAAQALLELQEVIGEWKEQGRISLEEEMESWKIIMEACRTVQQSNQRQSLVMESCCYRIAERMHTG